MPFLCKGVFHPNICLFLGACFEGNDVYIVTELLEGNVAALLRNPAVKLSFYQKVMINADAAKGMAWLHASRIVHRDIKPSNYLYQKSGENKFHIKVRRDGLLFFFCFPLGPDKKTKTNKVCDFGLSDLNVPAVREKNPKGTPLYMSPEVLLGRPLSEKVDVYSWAVTMWEILTGQVSRDDNSFTPSPTMYNHVYLIIPCLCVSFFFFFFKGAIFQCGQRGIVDQICLP